MRIPRSTLWALLLCAVAAPSRASVVVPLSIEEMVDRAEQVAVARVESQQARFTADRGAIYTEVTLSVLTPLKGGAASGDRLVLRREGGVVGRLGMRVSGAASFTTGEEVVVFLERRGASLWTVGMAQGALRVAEEEGRRVAIRQGAGLAWVSGTSPVEPAVMPLDQLLSRIAARVGSGR